MKLSTIMKRAGIVELPKKDMEIPMQVPKRVPPSGMSPSSIAHTIRTFEKTPEPGPNLRYAIICMLRELERIKSAEQSPKP